MRRQEPSNIARYLARVGRQARRRSFSPRGVDSDLPIRYNIDQS
jgi:hypothetical protein